ncbi:PRC-barrel domain-containing protein [Maritimibacter sp. HL-12]|uniref:PRC-barrel domain-containing protein n=1 Tax=Maritimibacter sp. HL-12 TaxID=1162418 RepID=UPI000A0F26DF|nr:PRC-barrel domain-containing protein [Maritimibacter sp. HL-12]SMH53272.1 PRC-barrel domain-containing protein [Maritimibacter sp. HL-12]
MRRILATTAFAALIAAPGLAQYDADAGVEGEAEAESAAEIDTEGMSGEAAAGITAEELIDAEVYDATGTNFTNVSDLVVNDDNMVTHVLVDVGGVLGVGARTVAVAMSEVEIDADADGEVSVHASMTQEQIAEMPEYQG